MNRAPLALAVFATLLFHLSGRSDEGNDRLVDVGGYSLRARVFGNGGPVVVFESGGGGATLESWGDVPSLVAASARVVVYDRAGIGGSSSGPLPRTAECTVRELRTLLVGLDVKPPYVLVGHSLGGLYIRFFASLFPADVAGLVFIDPTTEEMKPRLVTEADQRRFELQLEDLTPGARVEMRALAGNIQALGELGVPPDRPAVVVTSMGMPKIPDEQREAMAAAGITPEKLRQVQEHVRQQHVRLVARFPLGRHVVASESGHNVHQEAPGLIADQILWVLAAVRTGKARSGEGPSGP